MPVTNFPHVQVYKCRETRELYGGSIYIHHNLFQPNIILILGTKAQICLKPLLTDMFISRMIDYWGSFEGGKVSVMLKAMSMYPSAVFLDIGCNIGKYNIIECSRTEVKV